MLADPVSAASWQPSQVVFTVLISVIMGMEKLTFWKCAAMLLTVAGALCLGLVSGISHQEESSNDQSSRAIGQFFFFANCLASSLEVIFWRRLLWRATGELVHLTVMAESYLVAACFMATACVSISFSPTAVDFLCPACEGDPWHVPPSALLSIGYSVLFQTIVAYCAQAWALRYAPASLASFYATAQPIMATAVTCALLLVGFNPDGVLDWPSFELVGAAFIIAGLFVNEAGSRNNGEKDHGSDDSAVDSDGESSQSSDES
ncbi:unnamed protein product [Prorocentrum cordatum]|uniref:WAT1-related protein n=1 Tax=Prorocentrum cordatum TaxID=2364126 RepID=A0ABN9UA47_9DINO|nr:unnamed protein product [Polarella glacialis]